MLRVIVESASGIPKKKLGNPDPIASVIFRGESVIVKLTLAVYLGTQLLSNCKKCNISCFPYAHLLLQ